MRSELIFFEFLKDNEPATVSDIAANFNDERVISIHEEMEESGDFIYTTDGNWTIKRLIIVGDESTLMFIKGLCTMKENIFPVSCRSKADITIADLYSYTNGECMIFDEEENLVKTEDLVNDELAHLISLDGIHLGKNRETDEIIVGATIDSEDIMKAYFSKITRDMATNYSEYEDGDDEDAEGGVC